MGGPVSVVVTDPEGRPIEGAQVTGISPSYDGQTLYTDRDGESRVPWALNPTAWINVRKEGFETAWNISVDQARPIRVLLRRKESEK